MKDAEIYGLDRNGVLRRILVDPNGRIGESYHFRDVTSTGQATLTRSQETSIIAGVSGKFLDLVTVVAANTSTAAVSIDLRSGTASGITENITIPAGSTVVVSHRVPLPANETAAAWTAQLSTADQSDSPVTVGMIAIQNTSS